MEDQTVTPLKPSPAARMMSFVRRHKVGLTAVTTTVVTATVMNKLHDGASRQMIEFLEDKGLLDEYVETHPIITK